MCLADWSVHVHAGVKLDIQSHLTKVHSLSLSSDSTEESFCTVCADQVCDRQFNSLYTLCVDVIPLHWSYLLFEIGLNHD